MKEPEFQCILKIEFENNFDLDEITKVLDVKPHYCISYEKSGYTKISKDKLSGAWWYAYPSLPPIAIHKWFASARVYTHKPRYFQSEYPKEKEIALIHV